MTTSNCIAEHDGPVAASVGHLCAGHVRGLQNDLAALRHLYDELAFVLTRPPTLVEFGPSNREPGIDLDLLAYKAREHIRADLHSWTRIALEEGPWQHAPADSVAAMSAWLRVRIPWLASRDYADEVVRDLSVTASEARWALQPESVRRVDLGYRCPEYIAQEGAQSLVPCSGTLVAVIRDLDALLPSEVICTGRPAHSWAAADWRALGRRVGRIGYLEAARRVGLSLP